MPELTWPSGCCFTTKNKMIFLEIKGCHTKTEIDVIYWFTIKNKIVIK